MTILSNVLPKGTSFARLVHCIAKGGEQGGLPAAEQIAAHLFGPDSREALALKAAVAAGGVSGGAWGEQLAPLRSVALDYIAGVNEISAIGRFRRAPPNVELPTLDPSTEITGQWLGESGTYPVVAGAMATSAALRPLRLGCIVPISSQLARTSGPRAENLIREQLLQAGMRLAESAAFNPENLGVADIQPAALSSGSSLVASTGTLAGDVKALAAAYTGDWASALLVCDPVTGLEISLLNLAGVRLGPTGGNIGTLETAISTGIPRDAGSPSGGQLVLIDRSAVRVVDEGAEIDMSGAAAVQMNNAPSAGAQPLVSLWQNGMLAFKLTRWMNWTIPTAGRCVAVRNISY